MERNHTDISRWANVIPFTRPRKASTQPSLGPDRDKAILKHYRRRLAFERKRIHGLLTDAEKVEGHMELTAELLHIAEQFDM
jgi:hypothetical protein